MGVKSFPVTSSCDHGPCGLVTMKCFSNLGNREFGHPWTIHYSLERVAEKLLACPGLLVWYYSD